MVATSTDVRKPEDGKNSHGARANRLLAAIFILGAVLRVAVFVAPIVRSPDEYTYTAQAASILAQGPGAIAGLAQDVRRDPSEWFRPSPLRVGYTGLLALVMWDTGSTSVMNGAILSLVSSCLCRCVS
jgi:hypothetical protein